MLAVLTLCAASAADSACNYQLDPAWPVDLGKIAPFNGSSGVDVDPVKGEVYVCQQRGTPKITVWDRNTGKLLRSWGDDELDTAHGCRVVMPLDGKGGDPEIWVADMGGLAPLQFGNVADLEFSADQTKIVFVDGDGGPNNRVVEVDAASLKQQQSYYSGSAALNDYDGAGAGRIEEGMSAIFDNPITVTTNADFAVAGTTSVNASSSLTWPSKMTDRATFSVRTRATRFSSAAASSAAARPPSHEGAGFDSEYDAAGAGRIEGSAAYVVDATVASRADTWLAISARDAWLP
eukprot:gene18990-7393_t